MILRSRFCQVERGVFTPAFFKRLLFNAPLDALRRVFQNDMARL